MEEEKSQVCEKSDDNNNSANLTISTKLSEEQLICKSPRESPGSSVKSVEKGKKSGVGDGSLLFLGLLQCLFGGGMVVFGALVIHYEASLSRLGGGIWAGSLAVVTGTTGILASSRRCCPLRETPLKIAHTVFLALSLASLAVSQLVVALAATGVGRDINKYLHEEVEVDGRTMPTSYLAVLTNLGVVFLSLSEFVVAAVSAYSSSRKICPCFRRKGDFDEYDAENRNDLVSSWLGRHSPASHIYVVAGPASTLEKGGKITPIFTMPPQFVHQPRYVGVPLIPAPLGTIPSPIIPPSHPRRREIIRRLKKHPQRVATPRRSRSKSKSSERAMTDEDAVKTYTGLDKAIAEEFIDICDSRNASLCSGSSCVSSCQGGCNCDVNSREYLVNKS